MHISALSFGRRRMNWLTWLACAFLFGVACGTTDARRPSSTSGAPSGGSGPADGGPVDVPTASAPNGGSGGFGHEDGSALLFGGGVASVGGTLPSEGGKSGSSGFAGGGGNAGSAGSTGGSWTGGSGGQAGRFRILPLGDSITGASCYRASLWKKLVENGYGARVDFVGSKATTPICTPATYDSDAEAYGDCLATNIAASISAPEGCPTLEELGRAFREHPADLIMMHLGTFDLLEGRPIQQILDAFTAITEKARESNPHVTLLLAQIIPLNPSNSQCPDCPKQVTRLDAALPAWAGGKSSAASPILLVNQWEGFNVSAGADTEDGIHPNVQGSTQMANQWYAAVVPIIEANTH